MSFLSRMYQKKEGQIPEYKNPNRVSGGLRAQNADHVVFISEDGTEKSVATQKYVESLEQKIKEQNIRLMQLEKKYSKMLQNYSNYKYFDGQQEG